MPAVQTVSTPTAVPKKLFYRINEVSKLTGLKAYVLRYWESEFNELSPEKDASDQRRYRKKDIDTIFAIRKLLYEDRFTIKGARKRLKVELRQMKGAKVAPAANGTAKVASAPAKKAKASKSAARAPISPVVPRDMKLGDTLVHLRAEVNDLLQILA